MVSVKKKKAENNDEDVEEESKITKPLIEKIDFLSNALIKSENDKRNMEEEAKALVKTAKRALDRIEEGSNTGSNTERPRCAELSCHKLIQHKRAKPLHVICKTCQDYYHIRCVKLSLGGTTIFLCASCNPETAPAPSFISENVSVTIPAPDHAAPEIVPSPVLMPTTTPELIMTSEVMPDWSGAISIPFGSNLIYEAAELRRLDKMDQKLLASGFTRSPSQPMTPADGNFGPEGEYCYCFS